MGHYLKEVLDGLKAEIGEQVQLVAVSKFHPAQKIIDCYELGHRDFGESRVQELAKKAEELEKNYSEIRWHFIGGLQKNKVRQLLKTPLLYSIHSVDSKELLDVIAKEAQKLDVKGLKIFIQVNTSSEDEKGGIWEFEELKQMAQSFDQFGEHLILQGLMTMGSIRAENFTEAAQECFQKLRQTKERLESELTQYAGKLELSMGMSDDYKLAISEGASYIRIGSKIFGEREY